MNRKLPQVSVLRERLKTETGRQLAKNLGVTPAAIYTAIRNDTKTKDPKRMTQDPMKWTSARHREVRAVVISLARTKQYTFNSLARLVGVSPFIVKQIIKSELEPKDYQIKRPGCPRCKTHPIARGLCQSCFLYAKKHGLLDNYQVKKKGRPRCQSIR